MRWRRRIGQDGIELLLQETIAAAQRSEAIKPQSLERVSVDTTVQPRRRKMTATIRRELRRRSAIEAMIGHMKLDGKLARNHLKGAVGDTIHALLCGAGPNLRLILRHLARLLRALFQLLAALDHERDAALKPA